MGGKPLGKITRGDMKRFLAGLQSKGLARATIWTITKELRAVLAHAVEDELISKNPATNLGKLYRNAPVRHKEIEPLARREVKLFLRFVLQHSPEHLAFFLSAIHTGLRAGELCALQWGDIDLNGKFLIVRRNIVRGRITTTKTEKIRRVDLSDSLIKALAELKRDRKEEWLSRGRSKIPQWVFCNREGNPQNIYNIKQRHFHKCLEKAGLRRIRFHDLRHTFASLLLQQNESLAYIKEQLGHSSIRLTVDTYGHLTPGSNRQAVNKLPSLDLEHEPASRVIGAKS
jgi:integrase